MRKEDSLAQQIANYMNAQYPNVVYHFDTGSGGTVSIGMAMRNKRLNKWKGYPDMFIAKPVTPYYGLFLELKKEGTTIYKKNSEIVSNGHIKEQAVLLRQLTISGYKATFGIGFDNCKQIIDAYLKP